MKKILFMTVLALLCAGQMNAQEATSSTTASPDRGADLYFNFNGDAIGFGLGFDMGKYWHLIFRGESYSAHGYESDAYAAGVGLNKRFVFGNFFLVQGRIYPYLGWMKSSYKDYYTGDKVKDTEFTYGAAADVNFGIRVYKQSDGTEWFVTGGYYIGAPEFETDGMFDNGCWGIGVTILM